MKRNFFYALMALTLVFSNVSAAFAQDGGPDRWANREVPENVLSLKLDSPLLIDGKPAIEPFGQFLLIGATGEARVIITLSSEFGRGCL